jgi:hypothetical protein
MDIYLGLIHTRVSVLNTRKYITVLLILLAFSVSSTAQESEQEQAEKARELFEQEDYESASKIYSTLLSGNLQHPEYNFRFGACQLFTIQDKEEPLKYLKFATEQSNVPHLAYFYYGLGLHLNYRFDRAIEQYAIYEEQASKKEKEAALVAHYKEQCTHGKSLVSSFTDISVVQRSVLPRTDFYREIDLSEFGGKIIVKPEDFMSEEDKKRDAKFLMYFKQDAQLIYYASYSEKNATGKDLYFIQALPTGGWSSPKKLNETINTPFDEDYPFIHPEGNTLYFASKGHNSMGGYDVFKSERRGDGSWSKPVNMEFAINTPWDDFMFISNLDETTAWFASNRETNNKQVTVYRIGMDRIPLDLTLIKGVFEYDGSRKAKITVEDMVQNKVVGVYDSERQFGDYLLDLRGSGKYKFLVEAEESEAIHSGIVEIPREKGLKQFRQEMKLIVVDGKEQLQIINHFDDPIEDEQLLTAEILKKQASLAVNTTVEDLSRSVELLDSKSSGSESASSELPETARVQLAQEAVAKLDKETSTLFNKSSALYDLAQAKKTSTEPNSLAEAALAAELSRTYLEEAEKREAALQRMKGALAALESGALESTAFDAQYNQLAATRNNFESIDKFDSKVNSSLEKRLDPTISEYETKREEVATLEADLVALEEEVAYYQQEIQNSKDEAIIEELNAQVADAEQSKPEKKAALERAKKELITLEDQKDKATRYYDMSTSLLATAEARSQQNVPRVTMESVEGVQSSLQQHAQNDPALLAFVAPSEAEAARAASLSESRKSGPSAIPASTSNDPGSSVSQTTGSTPNINEQIKAIEASESLPDIVEGD